MPFKYGTGGRLEWYDATSSPTSAVATGLQSLVESYNTAYQTAKAKNEALYNQMIGTTEKWGTNMADFIKQQYTEQMGVVGETTGQREADIRSEYAKQRASGMQGLARLGMANTTIAPTLGAGYTREEQSALNRLADEMQQTKLSTMQQYQTGLSDLMSQQEQLKLGIMGQYGAEATPDLASIMSVISNVGASYQEGTGLGTMLSALSNLKLA